MATVYALKVTQLDCVPQAEGQSDVVVRVHWAYTGTDGDRSAGFGGTTDVHYAAGDPFTNYANLDENQVAGWVLGTWTEEERDRYRAIIDEQMAIQPARPPWPTEPAIPDATNPV